MADCSRIGEAYRACPWGKVPSDSRGPLGYESGALIRLTIGRTEANPTSSARILRRADLECRIEVGLFSCVGEGSTTRYQFYSSHCDKKRIFHRTHDGWDRLERIRIYPSIAYAMSLFACSANWRTVRDTDRWQTHTAHQIPRVTLAVNQRIRSSQPLQRVIVANYNFPSAAGYSVVNQTAEIPRKIFRRHSQASG